MVGRSCTVGLSELVFRKLLLTVFFIAGLIRAVKAQANCPCASWSTKIMSYNKAESCIELQSQRFIFLGFSIMSNSFMYPPLIYCSKQKYCSVYKLYVILADVK